MKTVRRGFSGLIVPCHSLVASLSKNLTGVFFLAIVVTLAGLPATASASLVTDTYDFTASGFPSGAPQDPVSGSFTVTFDPAVPNFADSPLDAISLTIAGHAYNLAEVGFRQPGPGFLEIGGLAYGVIQINGGTDDFGLFGAVDAAGHFTGNLAFVYSTSGVPDTVFPFQAAVVTVTTPTPVPEPAKLALLGIGLAGIGFARRRKLH